MGKSSSDTIMILCIYSASSLSLSLSHSKREEEKDTNYESKSRHIETCLLFQTWDTVHYNKKQGPGY